MKSRHKTDFFVIGAAKSGSTALYEWLRQQDGIYVPAVKEPHYFAFSGRRPTDLGIGVDPCYAQSLAFDRPSYEALYEAAEPGQLRGDFSPGYLYFKQAAAAIHDHNPDAKIICLLRNPADRAFAQFMHHCRDGLETKRSFAAALVAERMRIEQGWWWGYHYLNAGYYHDDLLRFIDLFGQRQVLVLLHEDLQMDPEGTLRAVMEFLGRRLSKMPDFSLRLNAATNARRIPRSAWLHQKVSLGSPFGKLVGKALPKGLGDPVKRAVLALNARVSPRRDLKMFDALRIIYRSDIEATARMIGRDLTGWNS